MDKDAVVKLMESSQTELEWNANCDKVKASHGGDYPSWWFGAIVMSGVLGRTAERWNSTGQIQIVAIGPEEPLFPTI